MSKGRPVHRALIAVRERERLVVGTLVGLLLLLALGFLVHRDPRFPGSLAGGLLGISAAALMLVPLLYLFVKRIPGMRRRVTRFVSMRTLLAVHIYAGVLAPILGVLHSGHRFRSPLGIALTAMMLIVAGSGFLGRYLLGRISRDLRQQKRRLARLRGEYAHILQTVSAEPDTAAMIAPFKGRLSRLLGLFFVRGARDDSGALRTVRRALEVTDAMADLESAIETEQVLKRLFRRWLAGHIVIALILYLLLALHVWAAWYYGIRWLS